MTTEAITKNTRMFRHEKLALALIVIAGLTATASAATRTIYATDAGWYGSDGFHNPTNTNYVVGNAVISGVSKFYRDFFVFDLPDTVERIVSAELQLANPSGGFRSADPSETFTLYAVSTSVATLRAGGSGLTAIYDDLGGGVAYGSATITSAGDGLFNFIDLSSDFIAAAMAAGGGSIALGGALTTLDGNPRSEEYALGLSSISNIGTTRLVITTVPEPSASALLVLAGLHVGIVRRKRTANARSQLLHRPRSSFVL